MSRGFYTSWKTKLDHKPKLGDEFSLPTLHGMVKFKVVEMRGNNCILEHGDLQGRAAMGEDGEWYFKHSLLDRKVKIKVSLSDVKPTPPPMNPNIGFKKTYK